MVAASHSAMGRHILRARQHLNLPGGLLGKGEETGKRHLPMGRRGFQCQGGGSDRPASRDGVSSFVVKAEAGDVLVELE